MKINVIATLMLFSVAAFAQHPLTHPTDAVAIRYARSQPVVRYILGVDSADLSGVNVEMRVRNAPATFRIAMAAHPEYDDRYWRFVENMHAESSEGRTSITREDSALWRITAPGSDVTIFYRVQYPPSQYPQRSAWRPFLSPSGALVGDLHSFAYIVGATLAPAYVSFELPQGWHIATGLDPTVDPRTFFAPSAGVLMDCPVFVGHFHDWRFAVDGVPHRVVYWGLPNESSFDSSALVQDIMEIVKQAMNLFGRAPYRDYTFLLQDGARGALEHMNSVTLGLPSESLTRSLKDALSEIAHEYFHTWNLMRLRPLGYGDVSYQRATLSRGLWWSEGLTMFYADLCLRRAGLPVNDSTRITHMERLIRAYLSNPGNSSFSAERVSLAAYDVPGSLGDYFASTHLQGELIGAMLDFIVRDATENRRSIDDVMREMFVRFSGERGFTGHDVERAVEDIGGCDVHAFFEAHVRGSKPIEFDRFLALLGLRTRVEWNPASGEDGRLSPDLRVYSWQPLYEQLLRVGILDPKGCWGKAGLHTGDRLLAIDGNPIRSIVDFRNQVNHHTIGDTVAMDVRRASGVFRLNVVVTGYQVPLVRIEEVPTATERQRAFRARWLSGNG